MIRRCKLCPYLDTGRSLPGGYGNAPFAWCVVMRCYVSEAGTCIDDRRRLESGERHVREIWRVDDASA